MSSPSQLLHPSPFTVDNDMSSHSAMGIQNCAIACWPVGLMKFSDQAFCVCTFANSTPLVESRPKLAIEPNVISQNIK